MPDNNRSETSFAFHTVSMVAPREIKNPEVKAMVKAVTTEVVKDQAERYDASK